MAASLPCPTPQLKRAKPQMSMRDLMQQQEQQRRYVETAAQCPVNKPPMTLGNSATPSDLVFARRLCCDKTEKFNNNYDDVNRINCARVTPNFIVKRAARVSLRAM